MQMHAIQASFEHHEQMKKIQILYILYILSSKSDIHLQIHKHTHICTSRSTYKIIIHSYIMTYPSGRYIGVYIQVMYN